MKTYQYFLFFLSISFIFYLLGETQVALALIVVIFCMLPAMWIALRTSYLSLKIFCATSLITQVITVPVFYLQADRYAFSNYRPFGFTGIEALPVFLILGSFLFLLASLVKISELTFGRSMLIMATKLNTSKVIIKDELSTGRAKFQTPYIFGILILIAISLPVKFWMFDMGIGIVGVSPTKLPYHLSGILFYLFSFIVPLTIGYLYLKTKRASLVLAILISVYALLLGISSVSKGVVLLTTIPIIAFAWLDRRWLILIITTIMAAFGVLIAAAARLIVYKIDGLTTGSFTELGIIGTLFETIVLLDWTPEKLLIFAQIADRIEGFQGLFLASKFNPDAVDGAWGLFIKTINNNWVDLDHNAMHIEYLGYTIPDGFYGVAASLNAWMMMAVNQSYFMLLPFVIYGAITLLIVEKAIMSAAHKYKIPLPLAQACLFFVTLLFYTAPGTLVFITMLTVSLILGIMPAMRFGVSLRPMRA